MKPTGLKFNKEVYISLPYYDNDQDGLVDQNGIDVNNLFCFQQINQGDVWLPSPKISIDMVNRIIKTKTVHFSSYTLADPIIEKRIDTERATVYSFPYSPVNPHILDDIATSSVSTIAGILWSQVAPSLFFVPSIITVPLEIIGGLTELFDPVIITPLSSEYFVDNGKIVGNLEDHNCSISGLVYLDFIGTERTDENMDNYEALHLKIQGKYTIPEYDSIEILTESEIRSLDPKYSYIIIPKAPFSLKNVPLIIEGQEVMLSASVCDRSLWGGGFWMLLAL